MTANTMRVCKVARSVQKKIDQTVADALDQAPWTQQRKK
jgi:hypothetical protein